MKRITLLAAAAISAACSGLPVGLPDGQDVYETQRRAFDAYDGEQDAQAERMFLALLRSTPDDALSWFYLGNLYARTGRPDQAINAYERSLAFKGDNARAWHNLGVLRLRQARAAFIRAGEMAPADDELLGRVAKVIGALENVPLSDMKGSAAADTGKRGR